MHSRANTGEEVGRVDATDRDNHFIVYSMVGGNTDRYYIDSSSGVIYLSQSLRGINVDKESLIIEATDSGTPSRSTNVTVSRLLLVLLLLSCNNIAYNTVYFLHCTISS